MQAMHQALPLQPLAEVRPVSQYADIEPSKPISSTIESKEPFVPQDMYYLLALSPDLTPGISDNITILDYPSDGGLGRILRISGYDVPEDFVRELARAFNSDANREDRSESGWGYPRALSLPQVLAAIAAESNFQDLENPMKNGQSDTFISTYAGIDYLKGIYNSPETSEFMSQFWSDVHQQFLRSRTSPNELPQEVKEHMRKMGVDGLSAREVYNIDKIASYLGITLDELLPTNLFVYKMGEWFADAANRYVPLDLIKAVYCTEIFHYVDNPEIASKPFSELTPEQQEFRRKIIQDLIKFSKAVALDPQNPQNLTWFKKQGGFRFLLTDEEGNFILDKYGIRIRISEEELRIKNNQLPKQRPISPQPIKRPKSHDSRTPPSVPGVIQEGSERHNRRALAKMIQRAEKENIRMIRKAIEKGKHLTPEQQRKMVENDLIAYGYPLPRNEYGQPIRDIFNGPLGNLQEYWEDVKQSVITGNQSPRTTS